MIVDLNSGSVEFPINTHICVIGSGPAGIATALKLSELLPRHTITLLESGGTAYEPESQALYHGETRGQTYFDLSTTRLRMLGGTTGHWTGWCMPLQPSDFQQKSWIPYSGWPITIDDLHTHYRSANDFLQLSNRSYTVADWDDAFDSSLFADNEEMQAVLWQHSRPPLRVGQHYRDSLAKANNLQTVLHANVTELLSSENGQSLSSAMVTNIDQTQGGHIFARLFVLACGGIENPRLLLNSNSVQQSGIGNDNDVVGRYYMDHLQTENALIYGTDVRTVNRLRYAKASNGQVISVGLTTSHRINERLQIAPAVGYFTRFDRARPLAGLASASTLKSRFKSGGWQWSDLQHVADSLRHLDDLLAFAAHRTRRRIRRESGDESQRNTAVLGTFGEQIPNPQSRISLSENADALGNQQALLNWQLTDLDYRSIQQSTIAIGSFLGQASLGRLLLENWLKNDDISWPDYVLAAHHPMGATRMSQDPKLGVVNKDCRVHSVNNLYIAGSSVFPTGGYANPTLTIVALAHRLADHLQSRILQD